MEKAKFDINTVSPAWLRPDLVTGPPLRSERILQVKTVDVPGGVYIVTPEFYAAAIEVADAWLIAGRAPEVHLRAKRKLDREWRTLANAVGRLARISGRPKQ